MSSFPVQRPRRLRENAILREMVSENGLAVNDLIYPVFAVPGHGVVNPTPSMPGVAQCSVDVLLKDLREAMEVGVKAIILFGVPDCKDGKGSSAYAKDGIVQTALKRIKDALPGLYVITDVCLCHYTEHGHCGMVEQGKILNDPTLEVLTMTAVSHAEAGADMVAPSDMMDGRVGAIRQGLDQRGFSMVPIMSYSAKYASSFYGPFRDVAHSTPQFGDRKTYQMDPGNLREAVKESALDVEEGADLLMVKPALAYMDVIAALKQRFHLPVACYNVSGEYAMVKAAAQNGWIDEKRVTLEILTCFKRAGADLILTYHAKDAARWLTE